MRRLCAEWWDVGRGTQHVGRSTWDVGQRTCDAVRGTWDEGRGNMCKGIPLGHNLNSNEAMISTQTNVQSYVWHFKLGLNLNLN